MQYRACGWKTTVDLIKKAKPSNEHLGHELRTSQRLTGWGREKREGVIGFWDQVENPFASCALAHSWSRLLHAGWKCKSRRNPNLHFSATRIGVICGTCEIDRHTYHERPFPGLCVRKTLMGASSASSLLACYRRWTAPTQGNGRTFSGSAQMLLVTLRDEHFRVCLFSAICVFSLLLFKYLTLWPRFGVTGAARRD